MDKHEKGKTMRIDQVKRHLFTSPSPPPPSPLFPLYSGLTRYGINMTSGEQDWQQRAPQCLQWCRLRDAVNLLLHTLHSALFGAHSGSGSSSVISLRKCRVDEVWENRHGWKVGCDFSSIADLLPPGAGGLDSRMSLTSSDQGQACSSSPTRARSYQRGQTCPFPQRS